MTGMEILIGIVVILIVWRVLSSRFVQGMLILAVVVGVWDSLAWYWILPLLAAGIGLLICKERSREP